MRRPLAPLLATGLAAVIASACSSPGDRERLVPQDVLVTDSLGASDDHALSFGSVGVGASRDATVTVSNIGDELLVVGTIPALSAPFSKVADACSGQTIARGSSCTVTVRFSPTALVASVATLVVPSNDPDSPSVAVTVGGTGTIHLAALAGYQRVVLTFTWIDPVDRDGGYNVYASTDGTTWTKTVVTSFLSRYEHEGLTTGTTWFYKVSRTDGGVESEASEVVSATPRPAVASMTWSFDDGTLQGWTAGGTATRWGVTASAYHSAGYSVTDSPSGNYLANDDTWLASPVLDLSAATTTPTLNFWRRLVTETFDVCIVEVSANGGTSYTSLDQISGAYDWKQVTVDLSPYQASTNAIVRFRINTDLSAFADGCYFDDVVITQ